MDPSNVVILSDGFDDLIEDLKSAETRERHTAVRSGSRSLIPRDIRRLIYLRDGGACAICGLHLVYREATLDHIVPWSAGGSDSASNLRITCRRCNSSRQTMRDPRALERTTLPVTHCCVPCWFERHGLWDDAQAVDLEDTIAAFCGQCGMASWDYADCIE